jgi:hypothetical protein
MCIELRVEQSRNDRVTFVVTDPWKSFNRNGRVAVTRHPVHIQLSIALGIEQVRDPEHMRMVWVLMGGKMLLSFV